MTTQSQQAQISGWIESSEIRNLFSDTSIHKVSKAHTATHYQRSDSLLSHICDDASLLFSRKVLQFDDNYATRVIRKATCEGSVPLKFFVTEIITLLFTLLPIVILVLDFYFSWTNLSVFSYLYICACGLSLYVTARVAKRDWMVHNCHGKQQE